MKQHAITGGSGNAPSRFALLKKHFLLMISVIRFRLQGVDEEPMMSLSRLLYDVNLNRSNSDCTTRKSEVSPFVRMSVERTSMRRKKVILIWNDLH